MKSQPRVTSLCRLVLGLLGDNCTGRFGGILHDLLECRLSGERVGMIKADAAQSLSLFLGAMILGRITGSRLVSVFLAGVYVSI